MPPDYVPNIEEIKAMMANAGGTNLAGQSMAGPVATGQSYAQSIAGGMPMEQVIAPGVSYSPEQSGGYTQADLDLAARDARIAELKKDLVWPDVPTTGKSYTMEDQMPYAPPGVKEPTIWIPGQTPFPGIGNLDFLKDLDFNLDFSNLPDFSKKDISEILKDYQDRQDIGEPEPFESFFTDFSPAPVMPDAPASSGSFGITPEMIRNSIEQQKLEGIEPIYDRYIEPSAPMNFTGLPQILPQMQAPYIPPQMQAPVYVQPRVEDIIAPIRTGSARRQQQPGLFSLV